MPIQSMHELADRLQKLRTSYNFSPEAALELVYKCRIDNAGELQEAFAILKKYTDGRAFEQFLTMPISLVDFVINLLGVTQPENILVPYADSGILPLRLREKLSPKNICVYSENVTQTILLEELLSNKAKVVGSSPILAAAEEDHNFDLIIGCPPFGRRSQDRYQKDTVTIRKNYTDVLIAAVVEKLKPDGKAAFVVAPSMFYQQPKKQSFRAVAEQLGFKFSAVIDLPAGMWAPLTNIPSLLVVIERGVPDAVFTGLYSEDVKHQQRLGANFRKKQSGKNVADGVWQEWPSFKGYKELEVQERIDRLAKRSNVSKCRIYDIVAFDELDESDEPVKLITNIDLGKAENYHRENCIYFPRNGFGDVVSFPDEFREKQRHVVQVVLKSEIASAVYLAGFLNHTTLGAAVRERFYTGVTIPHFSRSAFLESDVYLPSQTKQFTVIEARNRLAVLRNEIDELESAIWDKPKDIDNCLGKIETINKSETFVDWLETIPFPLASILWSYHTQAITEKEKYEKLLHFFEATAEFLTIIHLSVYTKNAALWSAVSADLEEQLTKNHFSMEVATFGTWLTIYEFLMKRTRDQLNSKDDREVVLSAYKTANYNLLTLFVDKSFVGIFKEAVAKRNTWHGHVGAVSTTKAGEIHQELKGLLSKLRSKFSGIWNQYQLILPEQSRYVGGYHEYSVKKVMGTRTPFERENLSVAVPMTDGHLHLIARDTDRAIELLPFVQVMPSPKTELDACYFYSRIDRKTGEARYISYHYEGDPEQLMGGEEIMAAIGTFSHED